MISEIRIKKSERVNCYIVSFTFMAKQPRVLFDTHD